MMCLYKAYQNIQIKLFPLAGIWSKIDLLKNRENQITVNFIFFIDCIKKPVNLHNSKLKLWSIGK